jgi:hypothetical protein
MSAFDPAVYGTVFADLLKNVRLMPSVRKGAASYCFVDRIFSSQTRIFSSRPRLVGS